MRKSWPRCTVVISSALLLCTISPPLRAQQSEPVKTETELILTLVKTDRPPKEISELLHANAALVTDNLWETLMAVATHKFYQNSEQAFRLYDLTREVALQLKDQKRLAKTYYNIARSHSGLGNYDKAAESYLESKKAFEAAASERDVIYILSDLGIISLLQERYDDARRYSEASISLAERLKNSTAPSGAWPDAFGIAGSLRTLGEFSLRDGDIDQAISEYQRALSLLNELNRDRSYDFYVSETYAGLGRVYTSAGDHVKALAALNSARQTASGGEIPKVLNRLGYLYMEQEDYAPADAHFPQTLKNYRDAKNQSGESRVLINLGVVQQRQGNHEEALTLFRQNLDAAIATKVVEVEIAALEGLGVVLTAQSRFDDALKSLNKGLVIARESQDKTRQTELLWRTAQTYEQMQDYARAEQFAQDAVAFAGAMHLPKLSFLAKATLGDVYAANKKTELAIKTLKDSIDQLETLRDRVAGREEGLELFFENKLGPYHSLVTLLSAQGKNFEALLYAERAKGRVLLDVFSGGRGDLANVLTQRERIEEQHLIRKISEINQRIKSQPAGDTQTQNELYNQQDRS